VLFHVIPAKAGIQSLQRATNTLDLGFHRGDEEKAIFFTASWIRVGAGKILRADGSSAQRRVFP
jgi:hypothetical protein